MLTNVYFNRKNGAFLNNVKENFGLFFVERSNNSEA